MRYNVLYVVALACSSSVAHAQSTPRSSVGCYAFFDRAGRPAAESLYWAPATARLDSGGHAVKLTPRFDPGRASGPGSYHWTVEGPGDSLRMLFSSGFSGTEFVLAPHAWGDTLRGRAEGHWDAGPRRTNEGRVTAVRIKCPRTSGSNLMSPDVDIGLSRPPGFSGRAPHVAAIRTAAELSRHSSVNQWSRSDHMLLGALIGLGTGAAIGYWEAGRCQSTSDHPCAGAGLVIVGFGVIGGITGLLGGALLPAPP